MFKNTKRNRGQASVEMTLALVFGILPLTLGLLAFVEVAWTYHGLAALTRLGARYAATHCFQDSSGQNVVSWLTDANNRAVPAFPDRQQLATGGILIDVHYWTHDPEQGSIEVPCAPGCSAECVPDSVTVSIAPGQPGAYQFNRWLGAMGLPLIQVPAFATTVPIESGVNPDTQ
jgi:hypothetical protein